MLSVLRGSVFAAMVIATVELSAAGLSGPARPAAGATTVSGTSASIVGSAWNAASAPLPGAHLQLRNVANGKVVARANADESGRFAFTNLDAGSYVVELVADSGKILAIGHTFTIAPGETVATFVRLGTKTPWFADFFANAAGAVISTAASQGITALAPVQLPVSGGS
jgi:hypothetical protein